MTSFEDLGYLDANLFPQHGRCPCIPTWGYSLYLGSAGLDIDELSGAAKNLIRTKVLCTNSGHKRNILIDLIHYEYIDKN
jgi:hypothetical protein